jgi:hypothetical protein
MQEGRQCGLTSSMILLRRQVVAPEMISELQYLVLFQN